MENLSAEVTVGGRPSVYSAEVAERICELIANTNMGLRGICRSLELCYSTVYKWTMPSSNTYRAKFRRMYLDAKEMQISALEEEVLELAGDRSQDFMLKKDGELVANPTNVARCRLEIAVKQWAIGRLAAKNKEVPEPEERERQWFVYGGYFVDLADPSTVEAWYTAEAWKLEQEKERERKAAEAAAAGEPAATEPPATEKEELYFGGVCPKDVRNIPELPPGSLVYDEDPEVWRNRWRRCGKNTRLRLKGKSRCYLTGIIPLFADNW